MAELPSQLGRYKVESLVGKGAMGTVYRGYDPKIDRTVALKTFNIAALAEEDQHQLVQRFHQEAKLAGKLSHPNIVTVFDVGEDFIAMEFLEGESLHQCLKRQSPLPLHEVIRIVAQIARALDHAHLHNVIHRDIKPANILLVNPDAQVKLTDFGIAKLVDGTMTATGLILGTPFYMSPEQVVGKKVQAHSDIFSLGVVAYEMLTGATPFAGASITTVAYKIVHEDMPSLRNLNANLPESIDHVMHRVLAKDPGKRYPSAAAFADALAHAVQQHSAPATLPLPRVEAPSEPQPPPPPVAPERRSPWTAVFVSLAIVLLIVLALFAASYWRHPQSPPPQSASGTAVPSSDQPLETRDATQADTADSDEIKHATDGSANKGDDTSSEPESGSGVSETSQAQSDGSLAEGLSPKAQSNPPRSAPIAKRDKPRDPVAEPAATSSKTQPPAKPNPVRATAEPPTRFIKNLVEDAGKIESIFLRGDHLIVADSSDEVIRTYLANSGKFVLKFDLPDEPGAIWVDRQGRFLVPDPGDNVVRRFEANGSPSKDFGKKGRIDLDFDHCRSVVIDSHGYIWVADTGEGRLVRTNTKGDALGEIKSFKKPVGLTITNEDVFLITDIGPSHVQAVTITGRRLWTLGSEGSDPGLFDEPLAVCVGGGFIFVADTGNDRVQVFDSKTRTLKKILGPSDGESSHLKSPRSLVFSDGYLYVGNGDGRISVFGH